MAAQSFVLHHKSFGRANVPIEQVHAFLSDPKALAAHMGESSMMMLGSRMSIDFEAAGGRLARSKVRMHGRMLGMRLSLEESIAKRQILMMKVRETIGAPKLLVIAHCHMDFELTCNRASALMRVFIDYSLPIKSPESWLGHLLGALYARWCTRQMLMGAVRHFT